MKPSRKHPKFSLSSRYPIYKKLLPLQETLNEKPPRSEIQREHINLGHSEKRLIFYVTSDIEDKGNYKTQAILQPKLLRMIKRQML